jgi:hypothetical protein
MTIDELNDIIVMSYRINNIKIIFCDPSFQTLLFEAKWQSQTYVFEVGRLCVQFLIVMRKITEWYEGFPSDDQIDLKLREFSPRNEKCSNRCEVLQMISVGHCATCLEIIEGE